MTNLLVTRHRPARAVSNVRVLAFGDSACGDVKVEFTAT
jgi:hypothetical protein